MVFKGKLKLILQINTKNPYPQKTSKVKIRSCYINVNPAVSQPGRNTTFAPVLAPLENPTLSHLLPSALPSITQLKKLMLELSCLSCLSWLLQSPGKSSK